jgi:hypothetical protein
MRIESIESEPIIDNVTSSLPWIRVCADSPYFEDENGQTWTPIGQNDAIIWPDFEGLFKQKEMARVEGHMAFLAAHGVNCIRIMMEYCHTENRYLEKPVGKFQPNMIQFWDDFFMLCENYQIRVLLTPFDTFWMARRWKFHPYNKLNGGPCKSKWQWLTSPDMLPAIKNRFTFFITRWGGSGALFAWDLWNEISPVHAGKSIDNLNHFVEQISAHIRKTELALYQKNHPQTVSAFAPVLEQHDLSYLIFEHTALDFATTHFYHHNTIDNPRNAHTAAIKTGEMVKEALQNTPVNRPFFDSEHGPIAYFKRNRKGLPEEFDDKYHRCIQWAHFASGAAGGGMRWPYRYPHTLTHGMRRAQLNLSQFAKLIDWQVFKRINLNNQIKMNSPSIAVFGCGDENQAIVWLLKTALKKQVGKSKNRDEVTLCVPGLENGQYQVRFWDTENGEIGIQNVMKTEQDLHLAFQMAGNDLALAINKLN